MPVALGASSQWTLLSIQLCADDLEEDAILMEWDLRSSTVLRQYATAWIVIRLQDHVVIFLGAIRCVLWGGRMTWSRELYILLRRGDLDECTI